MKDRLVISVLGHRNSGKSRTWNTLFGDTVRTGKTKRPHKLYLTDYEYISVFLVSGSAEERKTYMGKIVGRQRPAIVLCSIQYTEEVRDTIDFFYDNGYSIFTQWLNPGFKDKRRYRDYLEIGDYLLRCGAVLSLRNGKVDCRDRVREIRDFLYGWAFTRGLIQRDPIP